MKALLITLSLLVAAGGFAQDIDRGAELYSKGKYAQAESTLRTAVEQQPGNARANRLLGLTLLGQKKASEAEPFLRKADESEPSGETKAALALLYVEKRDYDQAEAALKDASGDEASYARGLVELARKRNDEAARTLESFLEKQPDHAYGHYYAGMAYNAMRRPDKMLSHFETFLKLAPEAPEARKVRSVMQSVR